MRGFRGVKLPQATLILIFSGLVEALRHEWHSDGQSLGLGLPNILRATRFKDAQSDRGTSLQAALDPSSTG